MMLFDRDPQFRVGCRYPIAGHSVFTPTLIMERTAVGHVYRGVMRTTNGDGVAHEQEVDLIPRIAYQPWGVGCRPDAIRDLPAEGYCI